MTTLGERFVRALAAKDFAGVAAVLHPEVDFRGMTPGRFWEATGPDQVIEQVLKQWFEDQDQIDALVELEAGGFGDRDRVGWRFAVTTPDGPGLVEQQAFYSATGDQIGWMRVMCSGFRPTSPG
jgi:SnoaL-like domain